MGDMGQLRKSMSEGITLANVSDKALLDVLAWITEATLSLRANTGNILSAEQVSTLISIELRIREAERKLIQGNNTGEIKGFLQTETKTPDEWAKNDGTTVHDPDGWRQSFMIDGISYPAQGWTVPITRQEWEARVSISSISRGQAKQAEVTNYPKDNEQS